jgi:hypothetical protein
LDSSFSVLASSLFFSAFSFFFYCFFCRALSLPIIASFKNYSLEKKKKVPNLAVVKAISIKDSTIYGFGQFGQLFMPSCSMSICNA